MLFVTVEIFLVKTIGANTIVAIVSNGAAKAVIDAINRDYGRNCSDNRYDNVRNFRQNGSQSRKSSRDRKKSQSRNNLANVLMTEWVTPKSQIDFDSYRLSNGKLFCPLCFDYMHSIRHWAEVKPADLKRITRTCPEREKDRVERAYKAHVPEGYSCNAKGFWKSDEGNG